MSYDMTYYLKLSYEHERIFNLMNQRWAEGIPCWLCNGSLHLTITNQIINEERYIGRQSAKEHGWN